MRIKLLRLDEFHAQAFEENTSNNVERNCNFNVRVLKECFNVKVDTNNDILLVEQ